VSVSRIRTPSIRTCASSGAENSLGDPTIPDHIPSKAGSERVTLTGQTTACPPFTLIGAASKRWKIEYT
jgi:hypothetical protein